MKRWPFLLCGVLVALLYLRLFFGVDGGDESFYTALAYRFALGDKPYIDEWHPAQGAALFYTPLVWLYCLLRGGTGGIMLFTRHLYFLMIGLVGYAIFLKARSWAGSRFAALLAVTYLCFIPVGIPNISYNTLNCAAFTLGLLVLLRREGESRPRDSFFAGICHGVAAVSYPPMSIVVMCFGVYQALFLPSGAGKRQTALRFALYALGVISVGFSVLAAYGIGPSDLIPRRPAPAKQQ